MMQLINYSPNYVKSFTRACFRTADRNDWLW